MPVEIREINTTTERIKFTRTLKGRVRKLYQAETTSKPDRGFNGGFN